MLLFTVGSSGFRTEMRPDSEDARTELLGLIVHDDVTLGDKVTGFGCALIDGVWIFGEKISTTDGVLDTSTLSFVSGKHEGASSTSSFLEVYVSDRLVKRQVTLTVTKGLSIAKDGSDTEVIELFGRLYTRTWEPLTDPAEVYRILASMELAEDMVSKGDTTEFRLPGSPVTYRHDKIGGLFHVTKQAPIS